MALEGGVTAGVPVEEMAVSGECIPPAAAW